MANYYGNVRPFGISAEDTVSNTTEATAHANKVTIPAGYLKPGSRILIKALVKVLDQNSTDTLLTALRFGGVTVAATAAHDVADNDVIGLEAWVYIDAPAEFHSLGKSTRFTGGTEANTPVTDNTTVSINADVVIDVAETWSVAHEDNQVQLKELSAIVYPSAE